MFKNKMTAMVGILVVAFFLSLLILMAPGKALAQYKCFLKIDGIPGESTDDKHRDWIDIVSWSFGEKIPASISATGGAATGKVAMQDFKLNKMTDKTSPMLFKVLASGQRIREVVLEVCRAGGDKQKFMEIKLGDVILSSFVNLGNSASSLPSPMEEISLNFARIQITYTMQRRPDGSGGGNVVGGWDVVANRPM